jgi:hypothetical protein
MTTPTGGSATFQPRPDYEAQVARDVRVIKGWIIFFGLLAIASIIVSIIGAVQYAHMVNDLNNIINNSGTGSSGNPFGG